MKEEKQFTADDMMDFLSACTQTGHPLYYLYKKQLRETFIATGDFTKQQALEWYLKAKREQCQN